MKPPSGTYHTLALVLAASSAWASPRFKPTAEAQATLAKGPALLLPADDLLVPLPTGKPVRFIDPEPGKIELLDREFVLIEDELFRLEKGKLHRIAAPVYGQPAVTPDGAWVVSVENKRTLVLSHGDAPAKRIEWHHDGQWEFERPYLGADGAYILVALREYGQPDHYSFLIVPTAGGTPDEVRIDRSFVPGLLRHPIAAGKIALPMFTQHIGDDGRVKLSESDPVVFDVAAKKLDRAPAELRLGLESPSGKRILYTPHREEHKCGDSESRVFELDKPAPFVFRAGADKAVQLIDFLPDESGVIAAVIDAKTCKTRGVVIPLVGDAPPSSWKPFPLPPREGRIVGRVVR
jgi:hypothetical protein